MKKIFTAAVLVLFSMSAMAQIDETIEQEYDELTEKWLVQSTAMKKYESINSYCRSEEFRESVNNLIVEVHQYDSLILDRINDPVSSLTAEQANTYKDILKLETEYSKEAFIQHMEETCEFRNEIEKNKKKLKKGKGSDTYNAQVVVLETKMSGYLNQMDELVYKVGDHLHYLYMAE